MRVRAVDTARRPDVDEDLVALAPVEQIVAEGYAVARASVARKRVKEHDPRIAATDDARIAAKDVVETALGAHRDNGIALVSLPLLEIG